ncbi:hypothetical protein ACOMHN_036047 [Nucella lapillus]
MLNQGGKALLHPEPYKGCDADALLPCTGFAVTDREKARKREENKLYWQRLQQDPQRYERIKQKRRLNQQVKRQLQRQHPAYFSEWQ